MTLAMHLIEAVAQRCGHDAATCSRALDAYLSVARAAVREGRRLRMPGIGEWKLEGRSDGTYHVAFAELAEELQTMTAQDLGAVLAAFDRHDVPDVHLHDDQPHVDHPHDDLPHVDHLHELPESFGGMVASSLTPSAEETSAGPGGPDASPRREILPLPDMLLGDAPQRGHDALIPDEDADRMFISGAVRRAMAQRQGLPEPGSALDAHPMPPPLLHDEDPDMAVPDMHLGVVARDLDLGLLDLRLGDDDAMPALPDEVLADVATGAGLPDVLIEVDDGTVQPTMLPDVQAAPVPMPAIEELAAMEPAAEEDLVPSTDVITSEDLASEEFQKNREQLFHPPAAKRSGAGTRITVIVVTVLAVLTALYLLYTGGTFNTMLPEQWQHHPTIQSSGDANDAV